MPVHPGLALWVSLLVSAFCLMRVGILLLSAGVEHRIRRGCLRIRFGVISRGVLAVFSLLTLLLRLLLFLMAGRMRNTQLIALLPTLPTTVVNRLQFLPRHLISGLCRVTVCSLTFLRRQLTLHRRLCYPWLSMPRTIRCLSLWTIGLLSLLM